MSGGVVVGGVVGYDGGWNGIFVVVKICECFLKIKTIWIEWYQGHNIRNRCVLVISDGDLKDMTEISIENGFNVVDVEWFGKDLNEVE